MTLVGLSWMTARPAFSPPTAVALACVLSGEPFSTQRCNHANRLGTTRRRCNAARSAVGAGFAALGYSEVSPAPETASAGKGLFVRQNEVQSSPPEWPLASASAGSALTGET